LVGPELSWIPGRFPRARAALASLFKLLNSFGLLCGIAHGECVDDFERAETVDLLLVVQDEEQARRLSSWLGKVLSRYEREVGKPITFSVITANELKNTDPSELDKMLSEGVQVAGAMDKEALLRTIRQPHVIITYGTKGMRVRDSLALRKELFGTEEVYLVGSSVYKMTKEGLVDKVGGARIGPDTLIVPKDRADEVIALLERKRAWYHVREVSLSQEEIRRLRTRSS